MDSRVLSNQQFYQRMQEGFSSLSHIMNKLKEANIYWELLL